MCVSMCVVCTLCVLYLETGVGVTFTNVLQQLSTGLANVAGRLQEVLPRLMGYGCKQKQNQQKHTNEHKHAFKGMSSKTPLRNLTKKQQFGYSAKLCQNSNV